MNTSGVEVDLLIERSGVQSHIKKLRDGSIPD
jgi:hypothetical protein